MPYAIIRAGGHQEKVAPGEQITVDHLKQEVGDEVRFTPLAVSKSDGALVSDRGTLEGASVVGKILKHFRGEKTESFQYRHKTGYRRHTGARQSLTLVEIESIQVGGETFKYTPAPDTATPEEKLMESAAEKDAPKKVEAKKAEPKKPAAKKSAKSSAKKPAAKPAAKKSAAGPKKPIKKKK